MATSDHAAGSPLHIPVRMRGYDRDEVETLVADLETQSVELRKALMESNESVNDLTRRLGEARAELRFLRDRESLVEAESIRARHDAEELLEQARQTASRIRSEASASASAVRAEAGAQAEVAVREARERALQVERMATERAERLEQQAQQRAVALIERMTRQAAAIIDSARDDARLTAAASRSEVDTSRLRVDALSRLQVEITEAMRIAMQRFERGLLDLERAAPSRTQVESTLPDRIRGEVHQLTRTGAAAPGPVATRHDDGSTTFRATVGDPA